MRHLTLSPRTRGAALAAACTLGLVALASPAFADEAVIGFDGKSHDVAVAVISCDNTEVAFKPVIVPTVGAAVELAKTNTKDNDALLRSLQGGRLPSIGLGAVSQGSSVPRGQQRVIYMAGMIGTGELAGGKGSEVIFTGKRKPFASFASGSKAQRAAATKAFTATKGSVGAKVLAAAAAIERTGGIGACGKRSTSAAFLVAMRNDGLYNALHHFTPSDDPKNAFSSGDSSATSVFASVLLKPDSKTSALADLTTRVGTLKKDQTLRLQYNAYVEESKTSKTLWYSLIGAALAAALIVGLLLRQRKMSQEQAEARDARRKTRANEASRPRKRK